MDSQRLLRDPVRLRPRHQLGPWQHVRPAPRGPAGRFPGAEAPERLPGLRLRRSSSEPASASTTIWWPTGTRTAACRRMRVPTSGDFDIANISRLSRAITSWSRYVGTTELRGQNYQSSATENVRDFTLNFINSAYFSFLDNVVNPVRGTRWAFTWGNGGQALRKRRPRPADGRPPQLAGSAKAPLSSPCTNGSSWPSGWTGAASSATAASIPIASSWAGRAACAASDGGTSARSRTRPPGSASQEGIEPAYFLTSFEVRTSPFSPAFINPEGKLRHLLGLQVVPFVDFGNVWEVGKQRRLRKGRARPSGWDCATPCCPFSIFGVDFADRWPGVS